MRVFYLVYRAEETIYSAEHLHETENKITEGIKEKNKPNLMLHGLILFLKYVVQQQQKKFYGPVRKVENGNSELTSHL